METSAQTPCHRNNRIWSNRVHHWENNEEWNNSELKTIKKKITKTTATATAAAASNFWKKSILISIKLMSVIAPLLLALFIDSLKITCTGFHHRCNLHIIWSSITLYARWLASTSNVHRINSNSWTDNFDALWAYKCLSCIWMNSKQWHSDLHSFSSFWFSIENGKPNIVYDRALHTQKHL